MFNYLNKYQPNLYDDQEFVPWPSNIFYKITHKEISEAETRLGFKFPSELRQFYQEIGAGRLVAPKNPPEGYDFNSSNEILPPWVVANFVEGKIMWNEEDNLGMMESSYEDLQPGDIPVFEISDSSSFMIMKPLSDNPNAVWLDVCDIKIEDSFAAFIHNLYFIDPGYYGEKIQTYLATLKTES